MGTLLVRDPGRDRTRSDVIGQRKSGERDGGTPSEPGPRLVVLAIEDEPLNRRLVHAVLEPAGYRVIDARSLVEAREALEGERPDIILLDVRLPDGDGLSLARDLKADPDRYSIPIIAATASALSPVPEAAVDAGCDGFLVKPIRPFELLAEIARQLERVRVTIAAT
jgi:CheY-like chemotaxis protein